MNFSDLDRAARIWAAKAPPILRPDVYQEAWIRFVKYSPLTFGGAFMMARHAMFGLMKRERTQRRVAEIINPLEEMPPDDTAALIEGLRRLCPEETEALLIYYAKEKPNGAERIHAMRQRRIIKQKLKGD